MTPFYGAEDSDSFCPLSYTITATSSVANFFLTIFRRRESLCCPLQINCCERLESACVHRLHNILQTHCFRCYAPLKEVNPVSLEIREVLNQCNLKRVCYQLYEIINTANIRTVTASQTVVHLGQHPVSKQG